MVAEKIPMPAMPALREHLRVTTARIVGELASPTDRVPEWEEVRWRVAVAVAAMHGVSALLAARLRWRGPDFWTAFLAEQAAQGLARQRRIRELLAAIDAAGRRAGLPLLALKGAALLDQRLYAAGERPMSDIDLLAREEDLEAAGRLVEALGYVPGVTTRRHREYVPAGTGADRAFGEHAGNPVKIELHGRIVERLPMREVDITAPLLLPQARPGVNPYPSTAALMGHLLLHAAGNVCLRQVRLIHLHDIAALADRLHPEHWDTCLSSREEGDPAAWWMLPPLAIADACFPGRIPASVLERATQACPPLLRWTTQRRGLADVSQSRLESPALYGWEWSPTPAAAFGWGLARLYPGRTELATNQQTSLSHHAFSTTGWARMPRWQRGMRILLGRAPRPSITYSVRRALDYVPGEASVSYNASTREQV